MKQILLLFLIMCSVQSFAQSKKKTNERLKYNLSDYKREHDSLAIEFVMQFAELSRSRMDLTVTTMTIGTQAQLISMKYNNIEKQIGQLKQLGEDPSNVIDMSNLQRTSFEGFSSLMHHYTSAITEKFEYQYVLDTLNLDGLKIQEQNEVIALQNSIYVQSLGHNLYNLKQLEKRNDELKTLLPMIDSIAVEYEKIESDLTKMRISLDEKMLELKSNYEKQGPKGFSDAYATIFPDVFGVKKQLNQPEVRDELDTKVGRDGGDTEPVSLPEDYAYDVVDVEAEFPGGKEGLANYLGKNLKYPYIEATGRLYVKFMISKKGIVSNVQIARGIPDCEECGEEVKRVISGMPAWKPAMNNGNAVNSWFILPVKFGL